MSKESDNCTIYLEKEGDKKPSVFVHGGRYPAFMCALALLKDLARQNDIDLHQLVLTLCKMDDDQCA